MKEANNGVQKTLGVIRNVSFAVHTSTGAVNAERLSRRIRPTKDATIIRRRDKNQRLLESIKSALNELMPEWGMFRAKATSIAGRDARAVN